jgi:cytochrome c-type biogenesis protein CcmH
LVIAALLAGAVLSLVAGTRPAAAQSSEDGFVLPAGVTWDQVNNIARKMYCDVCQGVPLDECESAACQQWREEIARQLGQGRTENEIIDYFVQRYGADVAALPRNRGDRLLVFAVPFSLVLVIGVVGAIQVRNLRQRGRQAGPVSRRSSERLLTRPWPDDIDPELLERLERELERLES